MLAPHTTPLPAHSSHGRSPHRGPQFDLLTASPRAYSQEAVIPLLRWFILASGSSSQREQASCHPRRPSSFPPELEVHKAGLWGRDGGLSTIWKSVTPAGSYFLGLEREYLQKRNHPKTTVKKDAKKTTIMREAEINNTACDIE